MVKFYITTFGDLKDRKTYNRFKHPRSTVKYTDNGRLTVIERRALISRHALDKENSLNL